MVDRGRTKAEGDWSALERAFGLDWTTMRREAGAARVFEAAAALQSLVKAIRPEWPSKEERELDLESHRKMKAILDRVPSRER